MECWTIGERWEIKKGTISSIYRQTDLRFFCSFSFCSKKKNTTLSTNHLVCPFSWPQSHFIWKKIVYEMKFLELTYYECSEMFFYTVFSNEISAKLAYTRMLTEGSGKRMFRIYCIWNWRLNYSIANISIQSRSFSWLNLYRKTKQRAKTDEDRSFKVLALKITKLLWDWWA